jgi:hypothetical protein
MPNRIAGVHLPHTDGTVYDPLGPPNGFHQSDGGLAVFKGIKNNWKKAEASVVIQNLLQDQADSGFFDDDPASTANLIVSKAWDLVPQLFDGRFGQRPHKLSVAAVSLAMMVEKLPDTSRYHAPLMVCLGTLLEGVAANEILLPLTPLDQRLLQKAGEVFSEKGEELGASLLGQEIDDLLRLAGTRLG